MPQSDDISADGYYADDNLGADELDLSFLDEETPGTSSASGI